MKAVKDLRKKSESQLQKRADTLRQKIASARVDAISSDEKNTKAMRNMRRELARVLTILNEPRDKQVTAEDKESKDEAKQVKNASKEAK